MRVPVKNILFDFGNVLFDLDLSATERAFRSMAGDAAIDAAWIRLRKDKTLESYETGHIDTPRFIDALRHSVSPPLSPQQIVEAWNAIFVAMPLRRFQWLERLRKQYRVYMLSNINELHAAWIDAYLKREHGIENFQKTYFDRVYYSHLIGLRKPDAAAFEFVAQDAGIDPSETLFIDDLAVNIAAAEALGFQIMLHPVGEEITDRMAYLI